MIAIDSFSLFCNEQTNLHCEATSSRSVSSISNPGAVNAARRSRCYCANVTVHQSQFARPIADPALLEACCKQYSVPSTGDGAGAWEFRKGHARL